jgi:hypothetical protein
LKNARERMDVLAAYREVGSYRGAAGICGTTHKTVKRIVDRHNADCGVPERKDRGHNYDDVRILVTERVRASHGRISAKRLLPAARAAGYAGSARNPRSGFPGTRWSSTGARQGLCMCSARCWPGRGCGSCGSPLTRSPRRRWR